MKFIIPKKEFFRCSRERLFPLLCDLSGAASILQATIFLFAAKSLSRQISREAFNSIYILFLHKNFIQAASQRLPKRH